MSRILWQILYFAFFLLSLISLNAQTVNLALTRHFYPVSNLYLPKSMASGEQMLHILDTSGLSGGTYLNRVSTNEGSATKKLVIIN